MLMFSVVALAVVERQSSESRWDVQTHHLTRLFCYMGEESERYESARSHFDSEIFLYGTPCEIHQQCRYSVEFILQVALWDVFIHILNLIQPSPSWFSRLPRLM